MLSVPASVLPFLHVMQRQGDVLNTNKRGRGINADWRVMEFKAWPLVLVLSLFRCPCAAICSCAEHIGNQKSPCLSREMEPPTPTPLWLCINLSTSNQRKHDLPLCAEQRRKNGALQWATRSYLEEFHPHFSNFAEKFSSNRWYGFLQIFLHYSRMTSFPIENVIKLFLSLTSMLLLIFFRYFEKLSH